MNPFARTLIVAVLTFASGLLGFLLQWLLPVQDIAGAKGIICSIIGFVTLLLALVLGLLIWTTYGAFIAQNTESQSLGPLIMRLDFALEQYGPEAARGTRFAASGGRPCARPLLGRTGDRRIALCPAAGGSA